MQILSHRGYWTSPAEKNTPVAFERSFSLGFGTETDFRDCLGRLVVSHDPPNQGAMPAEGLFQTYERLNPNLPLALNIKADGLQSLLLELLRKYEVKNYFAFDMAIPDALICIRHGIRVFTRQSEWEPEPAFYAEAAGVWLDGFFGDWQDEATLAGHLERGKQVCIVSPELHKREHRHFWDRLGKMPTAKSAEVMLCTDFPEEAREVFRA